MAYQTNANDRAFLMGSAEIFLLSSAGSSAYINLGAAKNVKLTENWDSWVVKPDNTPQVIMGVKNHTLTIEGELMELNFQKMAIIRGGLDTFSTTTYTFDSGGDMTLTPQAVYIQHHAATSSQTIFATIYYAAVTEGMQIPFPADDATDVASIPFKMVGVCQATRAVGSQLYSIVDSRSSVYVSTTAGDPYGWVATTTG